MKLVNEPELLLLDEPFSALDAFLRKSLQSELSLVLEKIGKQAVLVTHSEKELRRMCTKIYVMNEGHIIREGKTGEVFNNPGSEECKILLEE
ncbi:MAG: hypothetical protein ACI4SL_08920 [Candidatus Ornithospirochaeta sp.]